MPRKRLLILGASGSIGDSVLSVLREQRRHFEIAGLAARSNWQALIRTAREFHADSLAVVVSDDADDFRASAHSEGVVRTYLGANSLVELATREEYDLMVNAVVGAAGITPTLAALTRGIPVALANKETLVAAGPLVVQAAREHGAAILPIDSEHSAIFQCLSGERADSVRRVWLTSSGGPFWNRRREDLSGVSANDALSHPTWRMGAKITVDSATLFNKGLEVVEAAHLFGIPQDRIVVVRHAQSVVHSMVEFTDGSFKAQLSVPDMRLPILVALSWPERQSSLLVSSDVSVFSKLTFERVDEDEFPSLQLARRSLERGGTTPAAVSAADEIAVESFLNGEIRFTDIPKILAGVLGCWKEEKLDSVQQVLAADREARAIARQIISDFGSGRQKTACS